jgi:hypothetical protein
MSIVTFTGPIKAGDVLNTTGTTAGTIKNVGFVVMSQTNNTTLTQAGITTATATNIVIPANSHIINIQLLVFDAFSSSGTISIGTSATATELVAATSVSAVGLLSLTPGTSKTVTQKWSNMGTTDSIVYVLSSVTGTGTFDIIVRYIQAENA